MREKNIEIAKQILHEGEIYLKETINATDALERKATIFFSVFMSLATAVASIIATKLTFMSIISVAFFLFFCSLSIGLYTACYYFAKALKPNKQYLVGNYPNNLIEELEKNKEYLAFDFAIEESKVYQKMIEHNSLHNAHKGKYIEKGLKTTIQSVIIAFIAMLLFLIFAYIASLFCSSGFDWR